jgi:hypothetical protein
MCIVGRVSSLFPSRNKSDLGFLSSLLPHLILAMGFGAMVLGGALVPRSACHPLVWSFEVPIRSWFEVGGGCYVAPVVGQRRPSLWSWMTQSSDGSHPTSTTYSPLSLFTSSSPLGTWIAQTNTLVGSRYNPDDGAEFEPVCKMNLSPTTISAQAALELRGVLQIREFAHERWGTAPTSHFPLNLMLICVLPRGCVLMSMWWRRWRPGYGVATHHQACCLAIMVVARSSGVLDWESEASYACIQMASMQVGEVSFFGVSLCYIWMINGFEDVLEERVKAFTFRSFHQRRMRSLLLMVPRFNGRHDQQLSLVRRTKNLQLNSLQPQMQKPIRSLGEPPGYYRRACLLRPLRTAIVVARRSSHPIRHQDPLVVFPNCLLELLFRLLQSLFLVTPVVGVPHHVNVL